VRTNMVAVGGFVLLLVSAALVSDWFLVGAAVQVISSSFIQAGDQRNRVRK
jgi:hypothetical protein